MVWNAFASCAAYVIFPNGTFDEKRAPLHLSTHMTASQSKHTDATIVAPPFLCVACPLRLANYDDALTVLANRWQGFAALHDISKSDAAHSHFSESATILDHRF